MSLGLADFLIAVSEPSEFKAYKSDPANYMSRFSLSSGDMEALKSGVAGWIRLQAKSETDFSLDHPAVMASSAEGEVQISLVMDITEIFEASRGLNADADRDATTFEDERGRLFTAVPAS
jgi:hypothetical protein